MTETFAVGRECDAWCGRCKATATHTVVAIVDGRPKRVCCGTCNDWHVYSKPRDVSTAPKGKPRRKGDAAAASITRQPTHTRGRIKSGEAGPEVPSAEARWRAALDAATGEPQFYDYRLSFAPGDVVDHQTHGLGVVQRIEGPTRAIALFRDRERAIFMRSAKGR